MPRSSKHQSHKQGKYSLKEANDYYSDSEDVVKIKKKNSSRDETNSARISKEMSHSASGDKRKLSSSSQLKDGKDVKNLNRSGGGDAPEEYVSSKRRKDEIAGNNNGGVDRWISGGGEAHVKEKKKEEEGVPVDSQKDSRLRESMSSGESKGRSSKRHESGVVKEEMKSRDKEKASQGYTNGDLKRESEKESGRKEGKDSKDMKEKEQESYRDKKKNKGNKRESEFHVAKGGVSKKLIDGAADEGICLKREQMIQVEFPNPELKGVEKRIRHREGSPDRNGSQDARENDQRNVALRGNRANDVKYTDDKYKDGKNKEYEDSIPKDDSHKDEKHREDADKGIKQRDIKHREKGDKAAKRRHEYRDDGERENRREHRYKEDGGKIERNKDGKHWEDRERDGRRKDDTYRVDSKRAKGSKDDKYHEDVRKDGGHDVKYYEDGDRSGRVKDEKYREESERRKEEKHWKDYEDGGHKNGTHRDNFHSDARIRETKYRDDRYSKTRYGDKLDKPDAKYVKEESQPSEVYSRKSRTEDNRSNYDDQGRPNDNKVRKITPDKEDQQHHDPEKKTSNILVELVTDRGRSDSKNADFERTLNHSRYQESHSSSVCSARGLNRLLKQDESDCGEYTNGDKVRHSVSSTREYISSQSNENASKRDDLHMGDLANERRLKSNIRNSPGQPVSKSPSSTTVDWKWNLDGEENGQKGVVGSKEANAYSEKEGRGTHESSARDESSRGCGDTCSMPSPFSRNTHLYSSSNSFVPSHPDRGGIDNPLTFRSSEGDRRIKSDYHQRKMNDPRISRGAGGPWKSLPNWTPPVTNGYMPFQPCAPPFSFHPMLPQFPGPPFYGLRPMDFNHPGIHTRHGRTMGWRNPSDDVYPPRLHGQETNNASLSKTSPIFGSPDWNHGILHGVRPSNTGGDVWTSLNSHSSVEFPSKSEKTNGPYSSCAQDLALTCQPGQVVAKNEQIPSNLESVDASQSSDVVDEKLPVAFEEILYAPKVSQKNNLQLCQVYLSVLDISADLTDPETFRNCTNLQNVDETVVSDAEDRHKHIFYVGEVAEDGEKNQSNFLDGSLFSTISDSLFQKAMSLYLKQKGKLDRSPAKQPSFKEVGPTIDDTLIEKCDESVAPSIPCRSEDDTNHINVQEEVSTALGCSPGRNDTAVLPADQNQCPVFLVTTTKVGNMLSSSKACEIVMPELVGGCESVNLSRIHHTPESTG